MADDPLPRWDMATVFPSLVSPEFEAGFAKIEGDVRALGELIDGNGVRRRETSQVDAAFAAVFDTVIRRLNDLLEELETVGTYISCHTSTDATDAIAQSSESLFHARLVPLDQMYTRFIAWVGSSDIDALVALSDEARKHEYALRRANEDFRHQMAEREEDLVAELRPAAITGWARLHSNVTSMLSAQVPVNGEVRTLPMSSVRALANEADRDLRKSAYEAEIAAWKTVEVPLAAALNGIKGWQQTVRRWRTYEDDVAPTLFGNGIDRGTLEAMQQACVESFGDWRRYMDAKARALGLTRLAWYDLDAPIGSGSRTWTWPEAEDFVRTNFGRFSEKMAAFADRAFRERWVDAGPRVGKEGGAYCAGLRPGESRIMMNFDGSFNGVSTLAHELGHAYHNLNLADRTPIQRETPATLAETASIFSETLAFESAIECAEPSEKLGLLNTSLQGSLQVVVDIHSRFLFEKGVFDRRAERDLTVPELCDLMVSAQRETYGNNVDPVHPYMWAVKGHYYGPTFYNYPYTYGLLFGVGLYAQYRQDPEGFRKQYDDLLSSTGMADGVALGRRFGVDVSTVEFWRSSLDILRAQIAEFERLVASA